MDEEVDELVQEFLVESYENIDQLDQLLVTLEDNPEPDVLAGIFRTIHTIKGTCGFLGYEKLESITHVGENLLSKLRDGELHIDAEITSALLATVDAVREILTEIEGSGAEGDGDYSALVKTLEALQDASRQAGGGSVSGAGGPEEGAAPEPVSPPPKKTAAKSGGGAKGAGRKGSSVAGATIRVDVGLLDHLMNQVGELVLARNQIVQCQGRGVTSELTAAAQRLNLITTELQEGVMKTRMQPIRNLWSKLPRVVRDLSLSCGKQVTVEMEGEDTELDKTILEAMKDPMTHIVRNAVDHGVESPERRVAAGKPPGGVLSLKAFHAGGEVIIEIKDNGGGIDPGRIGAKAVQRGIITEEQLARMPEGEVLSMIFAPGFSTAEQVTNVSGRGVGMDVVRTNIERIGGNVGIQSVVGVGTTFRIKIPLTLAIVPALILGCHGQRYAVPQLSLSEVVKIDGAQAADALELIHSTPVYRLRGRLLPVLFLDQVLRLTPLSVPERVRTHKGPLTLVVLQADGRQFGMVVDRVFDTEEIVVKPLHNGIKELKCYAGATIMGDGRVALILDVSGVARRAEMVGERTDSSGSGEAVDIEERGDRRNSLLLCRSPDDGRLAVPLDGVLRLEEFSCTSIEYLGGHPMIQYRGDILPLVDVNSVLIERRAEPRHEAAEDADDSGESWVQVIIHRSESGSVGLVVDQILDTVQEQVVVREGGTRDGVSGTAIIRGRVTEILDIPATLASFGMASMERPAVVQMGMSL